MNERETTKQHEPSLVGMRTALKLIFTDEETAPSFRSFSSWKAKGYFSTVKIGKRVFVNVEQARKELEKRFTVNANS